MILHISIPAFEPLNVANVLAELSDGEIRPFKPLNNAYMVYANDEFSSGFEVYPANIEFQPGITEDEPSRFIRLKHNKKFSPVHCAMVTKLSADEIKAIAQREKWRCIYTRRANSFNLFELWLENHFLLELIIEADLAEAKQALRCEKP